MALFLFGAACTTSSSDKNADSAADSLGDAATPTQTATLVAAPNPTEGTDTTQTGELPPLNLEEVLQTGIDAGEWTYEEGLILILKYLLNQADEADIPGISQAAFQSGTRIAQLAKAYIEQPDGDPETQAELARLLDILFIPLDILDRISRPLSEARGTDSALHLAALSNHNFAAQNQDACQQALETGNYDLLTEDTVCFLSEKKEINLTTTIWVYYPIWPDGSEIDPSSIRSILDLLGNIAMLYESYPGLEVNNFHFIIVPPELQDLENPTTNLPETNFPDACQTVISNPDEFSGSESQQQKVARDMFSCVYRWSFINTEDNFSWDYIDGSSLYFSNIAFPFGDIEWNAINHFDIRSPTVSIERMDEENFIFFQWLGNVYGPQKVVEILGLALKSDSSWLEHIAPQSPGNFNRFVVMYLSEGIADENTGNYFVSPFPPQVTDTITVDDAGDYTFDAGFLVASRYEMVFEEEKRFSAISYNPDDFQFSTVIADQQQNLSAWSDTPPEIRSKCDDDVRYLLVANHVYGSRLDYPSTPVYLNVANVEQAVCDPCLLGAWQVDNVSFSDFMNTIFKEYVPQVGNFRTVIEGNYYLQFDTEGKIQTQRDGLTVYIYLESQFSVEPTLDPYNPGPQITNTPSSIPVYTGVEINSSGIGNYSADGDYMRVTQFVDVVGGVTTTPLIVESSPGGFLWIPTGGEIEFGPAFNANQEPGSTEDVVYVCEGDLLDITMNETGTDLLLTRVEKILPTPVPTQYIPTVQPAE